MSMSKLSLFYALVSVENNGIQFVYTSWIIISLCKNCCNYPPCQLSESPKAPLSGIMEICEIFSVNDV